MANDEPLCRKCGAPVMADRNVVLPKAGGVEHVDCATARKPLARVVSEPAALNCLACEQPLLPHDEVVLVGHDLVHAACHGRLRVISGASGPSAHRDARPRVDDPFAYVELRMRCEEIWLDAADARVRSRHLRR
jgi:hypothetical protein